MPSHTTIRLKSDILERAKRQAAKRRVTFTRLVEDALCDYLAKPEPSRSKAKITLPTFGGTRHKMTAGDYRRAIQQIDDEDARRLTRGRA